MGEDQQPRLEVPWCEDCRRHVSQHRLDRVASVAKKLSWLAALACFVLAVLPGVRGLVMWGLRFSVGTFVLLAVGATVVTRLRLEDRKETCSAVGRPAQVLAHDAAGWDLQCENPDWANLCLEANPGATKRVADEIGGPTPSNTSEADHRRSDG
jgi:hypothetical protein